MDTKYLLSPLPFVAPSRCKRDVVIIGGGHNGLIAAAYLAKFGLDTLVLERRPVLGGAAVTEEIVPGFKFSRASYLAGLLRPQIIKELNLHKYGFKYIPRDPSSFTPTLFDSKYEGKYLLLGSDENLNWASIAQFSKKDADAFSKYEGFLGKVREILQPLIDSAPPDLLNGPLPDRIRALRTISKLASLGLRHREILVDFYELMVGPAEQILDRWFESDILKATLATDAVIGAAVSPRQNGSAYVLVHHGADAEPRMVNLNATVTAYVHACGWAYMDISGTLAAPYPPASSPPLHLLRPRDGPILSASLIFAAAPAAGRSPRDTAAACLQPPSPACTAHPPFRLPSGIAFPSAPATAAVTVCKGEQAA